MSTGTPVLPGDPLGVEEEYVPGENVYTDSAGYLRASLTGRPIYENKSKVVTVSTKKRIRFPPIGSNVVGIVSSVKSDFVTIELYGVLSLTHAVKWLSEFPSVYTGLLPVREVAGEYVKDVFEYFRVGDVVLAKTLSSFPPFHLTTKSPQHGVLYALCSRCLSIMEPQSQRTMKCPACGNVENRKVSSIATSRFLTINLRRLLAQKRW
ncbi:MAG: exosome complex RNA-binding protein Csl4 [Acidilobaceae archaeon]|nr:exosome complex RNA-binding protein Csl4 [Acidilobaceae archaeon]MCX8165550.1 exosome complex RNA-binding protein Csl4 [Acidilobaceae archaeon]MDW7973977.1 exosome complex RNA-binding protein Csl4 [Sulfolobales archaeon]